MSYPLYKLNAVESDGVVAVLKEAGLCVSDLAADRAHVERRLEVTRGRSRVKIDFLRERLSFNRIFTISVGHRLFWLGDLRLLRYIEGLLFVRGVTIPNAQEIGDKIDVP